MSAAVPPEFRLLQNSSFNHTDRFDVENGHTFRHHGGKRRAKEFDSARSTDRAHRHPHFHAWLAVCPHEVATFTGIASQSPTGQSL